MPTARKHEPSIVDGPAAEREYATVVPADAPDSFQFIDGLVRGVYTKQSNGDYKYTADPA